MKQNSESIYSDPYPVREAYSQPESPNRYDQQDIVQQKGLRGAMK